MAHPLTQNQLCLLANAASQPMSASTLRAHSELRWLEHLGFLAVDSDGRFGATAEGLARLAGEAADSRVE